MSAAAGIAPALEASAPELVRRMRADPAWFYRHVLGHKPWTMQAAIGEAIRDHREVSVKSCHGAGKSFAAAEVVLWFLYAFGPAIVLTTAPTDRQVRGILWKEIRMAHRGARVPLGGDLFLQRLQLADDWWAWGFTAPDKDPDRFQGFHKANVLVVVDEAPGVSPEIFEAIDGVLSSENARLLMIGNPTDPTGAFGKSFRDADVRKLSVSAFETPNFTHFGITEEDIAKNTWREKVGSARMPHPKLVSPEWVARRYRKWGPDHPLYKARVKAEFPEASKYTLIPLSWIEAACRRELEPAAPSLLSCDVARAGGAETVIGHRQGPVYRMLYHSSTSRTMTCVGEIMRALIQTDAERVLVDVVGVGGGVVDRLAEQGRPVVGVNFGRRAVDPERFVNLRAEAFWGLRERFERGDIDLDPADEDLHAQLAGLEYRVPSGRIAILSKDEMHDELGLSSPDRADALAIAYAPVADVGDVEIW